MRLPRIPALCLTLISIALSASAEGVIHLKLEPEGIPEANYHLWIPDSAETVRAVIVHQHGCGEEAERSGSKAVYDAHWRELARKWNCALLGARYRADGDCRKWSDPEQGSNASFLYALKRLSEMANHPEMARAPWCLWGHSGGASWAHAMLIKHPDRTLAVFLRSGSADWDRDNKKSSRRRTTWDPRLLFVPILCNAGLQEKTHPRFQQTWDAQMKLFTAFRARGGFIAFAPDPGSGHNCGHSRFLAIPFFDACLDQRLPDPLNPMNGLNRMDPWNAWLGRMRDASILPSADFAGAREEVSWLPNERVARIWREFTRSGTVADSTPPFTPPTGLRARRLADGSISLTWAATPDFESGIGGFVIYRNGKRIAELRGGSQDSQIAGQFQPVSYHDTPQSPLRAMRFVDESPGSGKRQEYQVSLVNGVGAESRRSESLVVQP